MARHIIFRAREIYLCIIGAQGEDGLNRASLRQRVELAQVVSSTQLVAPPPLAEVVAMPFQLRRPSPIMHT